MVNKSKILSDLSKIAVDAMSTFSSLRKEIETMMPTAKNVSNITYFRLYQIYNDSPKLSAEYLQKARNLVLVEAENYTDEKVREDFLNSPFIRKILKISKNNQ